MAPLDGSSYDYDRNDRVALTEQTSTYTTWGTATFSDYAYGNRVALLGSASTPILYESWYEGQAAGLNYVPRQDELSMGHLMIVGQHLVEPGQPHIYAGDDPVNNADRSGLYCSGAFGETECPNRLPGPPAEYPISNRFIQWVETLEGTCSSTGNWCYVQGNCQIGYGHDANDLITPNVGCDASSVEGLSVPLSQARQTQLLEQDLTWTETMTAADIPAPLTWNQTYALTDFAYALGTGYFEKTSPACSGPCSLFGYLTSAGEGNAPAQAHAGKIIQLFENYNSGGEDANRRYDEAILYLHGRYTLAPYPGAAVAAAFGTLCDPINDPGSVA